MNIRLTYPNFSTKAITFTIDDGNLANDKPFISIVRPAKIKGTFNLCLSRTSDYSAEELRDVYMGFGIANHVAYHPYCFRDDGEYIFSNDVFDAQTADVTKIYKIPNQEGFYYIHKPLGWRRIVDAEKYIECAAQGREILEEIFSRPIDGFAWPFNRQNSKAVEEHLSKAYVSVRQSGLLLDTDNFLPPDSFFNWRAVANQTNLLELAEKFEAAECDRLRLFSFGIHSIDYRKYDDFASLREFAEKYGNRPTDFWYATVDEIIDYINATKDVEILDAKIVNKSDLDIYLTINDVESIIPAHTTLAF